MLNSHLDKLKYISENVDPHFLIELRVNLQNFINTKHPSHRAEFSPAVVDALSIHLGYCFLRNQRWVQCPLFQEIVANYLNQYFAFERAFSQELVLGFAGILPSRLKLVVPADNDQDLEETQRQFRLQLIILCLTAENEDSLISFFGFGGSIFDRIRHVADVISKAQASDSDKPSAHFLGELEQNFVDLILSIGLEKKECAWIEYVHKLQYLLAEKSDAAKLKICNSLGYKTIFNMLLIIGFNRKCHEKTICLQINRQGKTTLDSTNLHQLLTFLAEKNLIYAQGGRFWSLAETGLKLTATAFAYSIQDGRRIQIDSFLQLNQHYQVALLKTKKASELPFLLSLINDYHEQLTSNVLEFAITLLLETEPQLVKKIDFSDLFRHKKSNRFHNKLGLILEKYAEFVDTSAVLFDIKVPKTAICRENAKDEPVNV